MPNPSMEFTFVDELRRAIRSYVHAKTSPAVVSVNDYALEEVLRHLHQWPNDTITLMGVKDTNDIQKSHLSPLVKKLGWIWLTLDRAAKQFVGTDGVLRHPRNGLPMAGSSSGGTFNILTGLIDVAVSTDTGGSILGPALFGQLFGFNAKGIGLTANKLALTSDGKQVNPGIGLISWSWELIKEAFKVWSGDQFYQPRSISDDDNILRVCVPTPGSITLPNGLDMHSELMQRLQQVRLPVKWVERDFKKANVRTVGTDIILGCSNDYDVVISYEGPIDVYGLGDSNVGRLGETGRKLIEQNGRYLLRAGTISNAVGFALPSDDMGCGFVIHTLGTRGLPEKVIHLCDHIVSHLGLQDYATRIKFNLLQDTPSFRENFWRVD